MQRRAIRLLLAAVLGMFVVSLPTGQVSAEKGRQSKVAAAGKRASKGKASQRETNRIKHEIIPGETLQSIAKLYGVTPEQIQRWNGLKDANIVSGRTLVVHARRQARPRSEIKHIVKKGETFADIARKYEVETEDVIAWNRRVDPRRLRPGTSIIIYKLGALEVSTSAGTANSGRLAGGQQLADGPGYIVRSPSRSWGTASLINILQETIGKTKRKFPKAHEVVIGDLSHPNGGPMHPHKSHQSGRDVDATYYIKGGLDGARFKVATPANLDVAPTFALFEELIETGRVEYIFVEYNLQKALYDYGKKKGKSQKWLDEVFQYPRGKGHAAGIIRWSRGHDDHWHLRITCRKDDAACR